jgi:phosphatidylglycerol:prolipoprotein diacylglycerol transferase
MFTLAAWLHDWDPFLLRISGDFGIRWYGLSYLAGFLFAYLVMRHLARRRAIALRPEQVGDFILAIIVGVVVGGRLGSVLLYNIDLLWEFTTSPPWWGVLAVNRGGMASHGGIIGCVAAAWWFGRRNGVRFFELTDLIVLTAPFGLGAGRLANFTNGELLGRVVEPPGSLPWAVKFPQEIVEYWGSERLLALRPLAARFGVNPDDWVTAVYRWVGGEAEPTVPYLAQQIIEAIQRGHAEVIAVVEPLIMERHPSQLYQMLAEGVVLGIILFIVFARPRKSGLLSGLFLAIYGVLRIATEFWRLPDAHLEVQRILGLSRGQLFSLPMVLIGLPIIVYALRSARPTHGGWLRTGETYRDQDAEQRRKPDTSAGEA